MKASSRLKNRQSQRAIPDSVPVRKAFVPKNRSSQVLARVQHLVYTLATKFWNMYRAQTKYLVLAAVFFGCVGLVLTTISPQVAAEQFVYGSYVVLLVPFFLANYFLWKYWLFASYRATLVSTAVTVLLYLKLQNVVLSPAVLIGVLTFPLVVEGIYRIIKVIQNRPKRRFRTRKRRPRR